MSSEQRWMCLDDLASVMLKRRQGSEDRGRIVSPFHRLAFSGLPQRLGTLISLSLCSSTPSPTHLHELHYYIIDHSGHLIRLRHTFGLRV